MVDGELIAMNRNLNLPLVVDAGRAAAHLLRGGVPVVGPAESVLVDGDMVDHLKLDGLYRVLPGNQEPAFPGLLDGKATADRPLNLGNGDPAPGSLCGGVLRAVALLVLDDPHNRVTLGQSLEGLRSSSGKEGPAFPLDHFRECAEGFKAGKLGRPALLRDDLHPRLTRHHAPLEHDSAVKLNPGTVFQDLTEGLRRGHLLRLHLEAQVVEDIGNAILRNNAAKDPLAVARLRPVDRRFPGDLVPDWQEGP